jgi:hypothetical protein
VLVYLQPYTSALETGCRKIQV